MDIDQFRRRAAAYRAREAAATTAAEASNFRTLAEAWERLVQEREQPERQPAE